MESAQREDLPILRALGFEEVELRKLGLWDVPIGTPDEFAEAYIRRSKKSDDLATLRAHVRDVARRAIADGKTIRRLWFEQRSASKAHVRREEFENATKAILDGLSKTLYVWKTDRLSRRGMGQVGLLLDEFEKRLARLVSVTEGLDSSKGGRMMFAFLSERARDEAKDISLRTKTGGDAHKQEGRWPGGVAPYGLECPKGTGKLRRRSKEYPTARYIAERLLKNHVPATIANALNLKGILTRHGKKWRAQTIIHLAYSVSWAGLVPDRERYTDEFGAPLDKWARRGVPLLDENGNPISCGEGVVSHAEHVKILANITARSRPGTAIGNRARGVRAAATIMTGTFRCPHCKGPMGNGGRNYRCQARVNQGSSVCKGVATSRERADNAMGEMWLNHVLRLSPESETIHNIARRWLAYQDPEKEARKQAVLTALDSAASREARLNKEFFVGGKMPEAQYDELREEVATHIVGLKAELSELSKGSDLSTLMTAESLAALWASEGISGKRALLLAALKRVTITPAKHKGDRTPITQRLVVEWHDTNDSLTDEAVEAALKNVERSANRRLATILEAQQATADQERALADEPTATLAASPPGPVKPEPLTAEELRAQIMALTARLDQENARTHQKTAQEHSRAA